MLGYQISRNIGGGGVTILQAKREEEHFWQTRVFLINQRILFSQRRCGRNNTRYYYVVSSLGMV